MNPAERQVSSPSSGKKEKGIFGLLVLLISYGKMIKHLLDAYCLMGVFDLEMMYDRAE
jgi:hypothetical protein